MNTPTAAGPQAPDTGQFTTWQAAAALSSLGTQYHEASRSAIIPVILVLVMCVCTPLRPCHVGPAPAPPAIVS